MNIWMVVLLVESIAKIRTDVKKNLIVDPLTINFCQSSPHFAYFWLGVWQNDSEYWETTSENTKRRVRKGER